RRRRSDQNANWSASWWTRLRQTASVMSRYGMTARWWAGSPPAAFATTSVDRWRSATSPPSSRQLSASSWRSWASAATPSSRHGRYSIPLANACVVEAVGSEVDQKTRAGGYGYVRRVFDDR